MIDPNFKIFVIVDEDEDGFAIGDKQGRGLAALRARGDSLSRRGSKDDMAADGQRKSSSGEPDKKTVQDVLLGGLAGLTGGAGRSRKNSQPVITDKGDGTHEVSYVPPPVGDPYEVRS